MELEKYRDTAGRRKRIREKAVDQGMTRRGEEGGGEERRGKVENAKKRDEERREKRRKKREKREERAGNGRNGAGIYVGDAPRVTLHPEEQRMSECPSLHCFGKKTARKKWYR